MGILSELGHKGDVEVRWDPSNPDDVESARQAFRALKGKGFTAFRVQADRRSKGELIHEFDPNAEKIIMVPQIIGG